MFPDSFPTDTWRCSLTEVWVRINLPSPVDKHDIGNRSHTSTESRCLSRLPRLQREWRATANSQEPKAGTCFRTIAHLAKNSYLCRREAGFCRCFERFHPCHVRLPVALSSHSSSRWNLGSQLLLSREIHSNFIYTHRKHEEVRATWQLTLPIILLHD